MLGYCNAFAALCNAFGKVYMHMTKMCMCTHCTASRAVQDSSTQQVGILGSHLKEEQRLKASWETVWIIVGVKFKC